ncbi:hypothetical protein U6G28_03280 [Actinomycetaceae bacterium MB13-C1-2]|nr:hypothetical protein U6G28_03280 [Actinomycetaceae bacterium MB13-C1-2]
MSNVPPNPYMPEDNPADNPYRPPSEDSYSHPLTDPTSPAAPDTTGAKNPWAPDQPRQNADTGSAYAPSYSTGQPPTAGPSYSAYQNGAPAAAYQSPYVPANFSNNRASKNSKTAIVVIIVAVIAGIVGLFIMAALLFSPSTDSSRPDPTQVDPNRGSSQTKQPSTTSSNSASGTRDNPNAIGSELVSSDWTIIVTGVDMNATDYLISEDSYLEEELGSGMKYILVDLTATYTGEETGLSYEVITDFVSSKGQVYNEAYAYFPDRWGDIAEVYPGGELSGRVALAIPEDEAGVIRITPGYSYDVEPFFVATE